MTFVETLTIELKRQLTSSLAKEIVAFANTEGGTIYIGVEDDGSVIGVPDAASVEESVNNAIHDAIEPDLTMFAEAHVERFDDADIVVVHVHSGPDKPYCIAGKGLRPEGVFVRRRTSAQPLSFDGIRRMLRETGGLRGRALPDAGPDLPWDRAGAPAQRYRLRRRPDAHVGAGGAGWLLREPRVSALGPMRDGHQAGPLPRAPQGAVPDAARVRGVPAGAGRGRAGGAGPAQQREREFDGGPARRDQRDYPPEALREALCNAIVHRDYSVPAAIHVNLHDDRCELLSPGGLPQGAHRTGALAGISVPRNAKLVAAGLATRPAGASIGAGNRAVLGLLTWSLAEVAVAAVLTAFENAC